MIQPKGKEEHKKGKKVPLDCVEQIRRRGGIMYSGVLAKV